MKVRKKQSGREKEKTQAKDDCKRWNVGDYVKNINKHKRERVHQSV